MNENNPYKQLVRFIRTVGRNVVDDQVFSRATSMAFTTVISLVPLTMVVFSFGGFDQIGTSLFKSFSQFLVPEGNEEMIRALDTFTNNARRLGAFGTMLFLVAALMLLNATENHLNSIFRARARRGTVRRFGMYIAALALISFMFGSGFGPISGMLDAWQRVSPPGQQVIGVILSILGTMIGMMLLFTLLCDAKVRFRNSPGRISHRCFGLPGGEVRFYTVDHKIGTAICDIRLCGLHTQITYLAECRLGCLSYRRGNYLCKTDWRRSKDASQTRNSRRRNGNRLEIVFNTAEDFRLGNRPPGLKDLAHRISADERQVDTLLKRLEQGGLIHQVTQHPVGFLPAVAPADLSASRVFDVITGWSEIDGNTDIGDATRLIRTGISSSLGERSVRSFLTDDNKKYDS
jgi:YihY family inner membrane protein